ncbi:MAG: DNA-3-methyladenine glycosylase 2 family protein [Defluviitaleaceae bacterium]|nr:DNA-3-methyladenine glycosylase 2 family protein [Defluviitaleaceae bacterium]
MDYTQVKQDGNNTVLTNVKNFDLAQTLDCGQAFRFSQVGEAFTGIAHGRRLTLCMDAGNLLLMDVTVDEFEALWKHYLDFGRNYTLLKAGYAKDPSLKQAINFAPGIRLMNQDPWETLVSFILSQNSNIPRIKKMIEALCDTFGRQLPCGGFTFPAPQTLAGLTEASLAPIRSGYRAKYIIDAAEQIASGKVDIPTLQSQPTLALRQALLGILGVGPKVADCVLLYGFGRAECYPVDVWIRRVMEQMYPNGLPAWLNETAGIAQIYLFHYIRHGANGI